MSLAQPFGHSQWWHTGSPHEQTNGVSERQTAHSASLSKSNVSSMPRMVARGRDREGQPRFWRRLAGLVTPETLAREETSVRDEVRELADRAFSRASAAALREGNALRILKDASENYPAWLDAIRAARHSIHFEMYIIHEDEQGRLFADALMERAAAGVTVRLLYDWMGGVGKTSRRFWNRLRAGGVEVRCYNPPRFDRPLGWVSRDHRKSICVDRSVAFV